jgi:hypothetical protein
MALRRLAAGIALAALLAGCTDVVSGSGRRVGTAAPTSPTPPGSSSVPAPTTCPHVVYAGAKLSFDCITDGLKAFYDGDVWPVSERKTVEQSTGWLVEQGAGHWGSPDGKSLEEIALDVRQRMIDSESYGSNPKVITVADRATTVDGAKARLLQTTFTLNRAFARSEDTKVKQEKLWIVAIEVAPGDVSLWYASVPDLVKSLWPKVPSAIAAIQVG